MATSMRNEGRNGRTRRPAPAMRLAAMLSLAAATGAHAAERNFVHIGGEARRIHVYVAAALGDQLANHLALNRDHVGDEVVHILVDIA